VQVLALLFLYEIITSLLTYNHAKIQDKKGRTGRKPSHIVPRLAGPGLIGTMSMTYIIHALKMDLIWR
jgi:predicted ATP-grasp superfamily ATP-dependent carboligase